MAPLLPQPNPVRGLVRVVEILPPGVQASARNYISKAGEEAESYDPVFLVEDIEYRFPIYTIPAPYARRWLSNEPDRVKLISHAEFRVKTPLGIQETAYAHKCVIKEDGRIVWVQMNEDERVEKFGTTRPKTASRDELTTTISAHSDDLADPTVETRKPKRGGGGRNKRGGNQATVPAGGQVQQTDGPTVPGPATTSQGQGESSGPDEFMRA